MACKCSSSDSVRVVVSSSSSSSRRKQKHQKKNHAFQRIVDTSSLLFNTQQAGDDENESFQIIEELPLNQIFQKAVVLQRSGDRSGSLEEYIRFLKVAESHDVDPMLYSEVHANMGAIYAMQGKGGSSSETTTTNIDVKTQLRAQAKESFQIAVKYRPSLGSAWVNLALLLLAEGKELGNSSSAELQSQVMHSLKEARQCCERALGMDNEDERSRSLANKLIGDIDSMIRQMMMMMKS